jgi:hypothetical protein
VVTSDSLKPVHFYASLHGKVMKLTFDEKGISKLALEEMRQQGLPK